MSSQVVNLYKKCGQTPLECIEEFKNNHPELFNTPITYAGRLDPLAEGVLLILIGDECHKKEEYLKLPKEYELKILFGFETDTYDLLGMVTSPSYQFSGPRMREDEEPDHENCYEGFIPEIKKTKNKELFERSSDLLAKDFEGRGQTVSNNSSCSVSASKIKEILPKFIGQINQSYPPYSSKTVEGKPLFQWAREGKIGEIKIPSHQVEVKSIEITEEGVITSEQLLEKIKNDISRVKGDFRQEEIVSLWSKILEEKSSGRFQDSFTRSSPACNVVATSGRDEGGRGARPLLRGLEPTAIENFKTITLRISCGSGFYARVLARELGRAMGVPSLALHILRTKVGEYTIQK